VAKGKETKFLRDNPVRGSAKGGFPKGHRMVASEGEANRGVKRVGAFKGPLLAALFSGGERRPERARGGGNSFFQTHTIRNRSNARRNLTPTTKLMGMIKLWKFGWERGRV